MSGDKCCQVSRFHTKINVQYLVNKKINEGPRKKLSKQEMEICKNIHNGGKVLGDVNHLWFSDYFLAMSAEEISGIGVLIF